jgi:methylthioribose-1-phosphate isomerase
MINTIEWKDDTVRMIDQTVLPEREVYIECSDYHQVADAIRTMIIRGAPAIGVAAAMGIALGAIKSRADNPREFQHDFDKVCRVIGETRPTAVNLFWAIKQMRDIVKQNGSLPVDRLKQALKQRALEIYEQDIAINRNIGKHGRQLIKDGDCILTHCNAGALATAGYGTALGVIRAAHAQGKQLEVMADETRPFLQGARLTAWELMQDGIPVTLIADSMAGYMMQQGKIDLVIVGADRIAANGDVANKIGTYTVAVLAKEHNIPFYVAAPVSTLDMSLSGGDKIPIEQRSPEEITHFKGQAVAPAGVNVANPAFDITPARYVTAIITERGIARPAYEDSLRALVQQEPNP